jgi:hypothetical protein
MRFSFQSPLPDASFDWSGFSHFSTQFYILQRDIFFLTTLLQQANFVRGYAIGLFSVIAYFLMRRWMSLPGSHLYQSSPEDGAAPGFPLSSLRSVSYGFGSKNPAPWGRPAFSNLFIACLECFKLNGCTN